jgi:hypothetical protein
VAADVTGKRQQVGTLDCPRRCLTPPTSRGHQHEAVLPPHGCLDDLALLAAKGGVAKHLEAGRAEHGSSRSSNTAFSLNT